MSSKLKPVLELDVGETMQQMRLVPMTIDGKRAFLVVHSNSGNIDPWPPYFTFPTDTLKLAAFDADGHKLWRKDLGPGVVPGIWFCPIMPFDLDGDGTDEVYLVANPDPDHPLDGRTPALQQLSAATGEPLKSLPCAKVQDRQPLSHLWRNFLASGFSAGRRRLITAQGTYGLMQLQCWDESFNCLWSIKIDPDESPGALGSHMFPVVDIDGDGRDELLWGERCLDIDTGQEIWVGDREKWHGHSDIVQPTLDLTTGKWLIYTCRESRDPAEARGVVMYDDRGRELWGYRGLGHMHAGWVGRLCDDGSHLCYAFDMDSQKHYCYDTSGHPQHPAFPLNRSLPVDFDGDGLHEVVYTSKENRGRVLRRDGQEICTLAGKPCCCGHILDMPGEQIVTWPKYDRGTVARIYSLPSATDTPAARRRFEHPFYKSSLQMWAVGYNWRNASGV